MKYNNNMIVYFVSSVIFIILMLGSGFSFNRLLSPMSFISEIFAGTSIGVSWLLVGLSLIMFCTSFAFFSIYAYNEKHDNSILLISALISIIIVISHSFSVPSIIFSLGIFIAYFQVLTSIRKEKEKLKRPKIYNILSGVVSKGLTILNISLALTVFMVLVVNPSYAEKEMSSMSQSMGGIDISDMDSLQQQMSDQQKEANYAQIEAIETSVLYGIYSVPSDLTTSEKMRCFNAINSSMAEIDKLAKSSIDMQLSTFDENQKDSIDSTQKILTLFKQFYPHITFLTIFMFLEMLNLFLKNIIVIIASQFNAESKPHKKDSTSGYSLHPKQKILSSDKYTNNPNSTNSN
ncbi:MAG: hypothetical protein K0B07_03885 [DPANN group archaeon]|nr:hypothetical protein [DPANN group archaeon]